jgi:hypothetical protein
MLYLGQKQGDLQVTLSALLEKGSETRELKLQ